MKSANYCPLSLIIPLTLRFRVKIYLIDILILFFTELNFNQSLNQE